MEPELRIIARPVLDVSAVEEFLAEHRTSWKRDPQASPPSALVEFAGRICYMSFGTRQSSRSNAKYIENLVHQGHESVLEHASWTVVLSGVSRALSHQFVRHRIGFSYSQLSQQYVDHEQIQFVEPFDISRYPEAANHWYQTVNSIRRAYKHIRDLLQAEGLKETFDSEKEFLRFVRSAARSILPNATATTLVFTANARALRHFLKLRGGIEGDVEMRKVAAQLLHLMQKEAPPLFSDFYTETLEDGSQIVRWSSQISGPPAKASGP